MHSNCVFLGGWARSRLLLLPRQAKPWRVIQHFGCSWSLCVLLVRLVLSYLLGKCRLVVFLGCLAFGLFLLLPYVNFSPFRRHSTSRPVFVGGKFSLGPKAGGKAMRGIPQPRGTSLQSASPQDIAVAEESGLLAGRTGTIHKSPAQSQRKTARIGATWRAQSTIHCSSCKGLVRLAYIYSACPELCWVTQASKV